MRSPHTALKSSPRSPQLEKAHTQQRRPDAAIKKGRKEGRQKGWKKKKEKKKQRRKR